MFWTSQIQNSVINRYEEIGWLPSKPSRKGRLAQVLDNVITHQPPKLPRRNPDAAAAANDFRRSLAGAGHSSSSFYGPNGNLLTESSLIIHLEERAQYTQFLKDYKIII
jgi:hypothetical protein